MRASVLWGLLLLQLGLQEVGAFSSPALVAFGRGPGARLSETRSLKRRCSACLNLRMQDKQVIADPYRVLGITRDADTTQVFVRLKYRTKRNALPLRTLS